MNGERVTSGTMRYGNHALRVVLASEDEQSYTAAHNGRLWVFAKPTWEFTADAATNRQVYATLPVGGLFKVALIDGTVIGLRMKVNDRWYVDYMGNLEPKSMPVVGLVDGKYKIITS